MIRSFPRLPATEEGVDARSAGVLPTAIRFAQDQGRKGPDPDPARTAWGPAAVVLAEAAIPAASAIPAEVSKAAAEAVPGRQVTAPSPVQATARRIRRPIPVAITRVA